MSKSIPPKKQPGKKSSKPTTTKPEKADASIPDLFPETKGGRPKSADEIADETAQLEAADIEEFRREGAVHLKWVTSTLAAVESGVLNDEILPDLVDDRPYEMRPKNAGLIEERHALLLKDQRLCKRLIVHRNPDNPERFILIDHQTWLTAARGTLLPVPVAIVECDAGQARILAFALNARIQGKMVGKHELAMACFAAKPTLLTQTVRELGCVIGVSKSTVGRARKEFKMPAPEDDDLGVNPSSSPSPDGGGVRGDSKEKKTDPVNPPAPGPALPKGWVLRLSPEELDALAARTMSLFDSKFPSVPQRKELEDLVARTRSAMRVLELARPELLYPILIRLMPNCRR